MQRLKSKNINSKQIDKQYEELRKKMADIQHAIGRAFTELKNRADGK